MNERHFFIPMKIPTATAQEKKVRVVKGKPVFYEPPGLKDARDKYMANLYKFKPDAPMRSPVLFVVKFLFHDDALAELNEPFPIDGKICKVQWKLTKPDTDNMVKLLKDCMTKLGFWLDDKQVAYEIVQKFQWSGIEGIYIQTEEMTGVQEYSGGSFSPIA